MWITVKPSGCMLLALGVCCLVVPSTTRQAPTTEAPQPYTQNLFAPGGRPEIYSLHIRSDITFRFATTHVTSRLANHASAAKEAEFSMTIPKTAFITNFTMTIDGQPYSGEVKEKTVAKATYERARSQGQSAARVSAKPRNTNVFKVQVNVAAKKKVDFDLEYQELLERRLGQYEHVINVNPGQIVRDLKVDVFIRESRHLDFVRVPPIRAEVTLSEHTDINATNPLVSIRQGSPSAAHVIYHPDVDAQRAISEEWGVSGQFVVQYDVDRNLDGGEIQLADGYFVHFFAPKGLDPVSKNILFVLDTSSSMAGQKIQQLKYAMSSILDDVLAGDNLNIVTFSYGVSYWSEEMVQATPDNIKKAKKFVRDIAASGSTNINDALQRGLSFIQEQRGEEFEPRPALIVFLTDGMPTAGITSSSRILTQLRTANGRGEVSIYSLGFGNDVSFPFLQRISLQNQGFARRIYVDSDASLQLQGFYKEISTPIMSDVNFVYVDDEVISSSVTQTHYPTFYRGSEVVVVGKMRDGVRSFSSRVSGQTARGPMSLNNDDIRVSKVAKTASRSGVRDFTERLWAYMTIKKLLNQMLKASDHSVKEAVKARAMELSLNYSFVTPLTSMVVVKPEEPSKNVGDLTDTDAARNNRASQDMYGAAGGVRKTSVSRKRKRPSFVDNDPHFIVSIEGLDDYLCFDINGEPGDVMQLLYDRNLGLTVNGLIVAANSSSNGRARRTYLGEIAIMRNGHVIRVTPHKITVNQNDVYQWRQSMSFTTIGGATLDIEAKKLVKIYYSDKVELTVLRHLVRPNNLKKVNFLGFYISDATGLSEYAHGIVGQLLHQSAQVISKSDVIPQNRQKKGKSIKLWGPHVSHRKVRAKLISRRDMSINQKVPCWNVLAKNGKGLLVGEFKDYLVPNLIHQNASRKNTLGSRINGKHRKHRTDRRNRKSLNIGR